MKLTTKTKPTRSQIRRMFTADPRNLAVRITRSGDVHVLRHHQSLNDPTASVWLFWRHTDDQDVADQFNKQQNNGKAVRNE